MTSKLFIKYATLLAAMMLAGCAPGNAIYEEPAAYLVWPPAPLPARIAFDKTIRTPDDLGTRQGFLKRLGQLVRGDQQEEIISPYGITHGRNGELYVVDNAYQKIHVFDPENNRYSIFPDEAPPNFINPVNITLDQGGRVFVTDSVSGLVHVFSIRGFQFIRSLAHERMKRPTGIVYKAATDELLVVDTAESLLLVFDAQNFSLKRIVGDKNNIAGNDIDFHFPTNIALSGDGNVVISDSLNFRVQVLDPSFDKVHEFGSPGNAPGNFSRPKGLAVDSDGHIYVIDAIFDNVQIFEPDGTLLIAFGGAGNEPGKFWLPSAISIDGDDKIYISDTYNKRIQVFQYWPETAQ